MTGIKKDVIYNYDHRLLIGIRPAEQSRHVLVLHSCGDQMETRRLLVFCYVSFHSG